jgi:uncharacterized membrane protein
MTQMIFILVSGLICEAVGVVYLNKGLKQIGTIDNFSVASVLALVKAGVTNGPLLTGIFFETVFFGTLLYLMSKGDVSFVWPLTSLGFVLTTLAARYILQEHVSPLRWFGVILIMLGAGVITYSEKVKGKTAPMPPPNQSPL